VVLGALVKTTKGVVVGAVVSMAVGCRRLGLCVEGKVDGDGVVDDIDGVPVRPESEPEPEPESEPECIMCVGTTEGTTEGNAVGDSDG
jgi:hypothetical protein